MLTHDEGNIASVGMFLSVKDLSVDREELSDLFWCHVCPHVLDKQLEGGRGMLG